MSALLRLSGWLLAVALVLLPVVAVLEGWIGADRWPLRTLRVHGTFDRVDEAQLRAALVAAQARVVVVLNLEPQPGETDGFSPQEHLRVLQAHLGGVALHTVIADADSVVDRRGLLSAVRECGAELVLAPVAEHGGAPRHDPERLSAALASVADGVVGAR